MYALLGIIIPYLLILTDATILHKNLLTRRIFHLISLFLILDSTCQSKASYAKDIFLSSEFAWVA